MLGSWHRHAPSKQETTELVHTALDLMRGREYAHPIKSKPTTIYGVDDVRVEIGTIYDLGTLGMNPTIVTTSLIEDIESVGDEEYHKETLFWFWAAGRGKFPYRARYTSVGELMVKKIGDQEERIHTAGFGAVLPTRGELSGSARKIAKRAAKANFDKQYYAKLLYFLTSCVPENFVEVKFED